jgi:L-amino acid N-acyltransferase
LINPTEIRDAKKEDLPTICEIFNQVISSGNVIFQDTLYTLEDLIPWFQNKKAKGYPVIVAEQHKRVIGFGACDVFRARECYSTTSELAVHLHKDFRGQGIGTKIIQELEKKSKEQGIHLMVACIDSGNTGSVRLHERLGFRTVGTMREVARKQNQWLDLIILEKTI